MSSPATAITQRAPESSEAAAAMSTSLAQGSNDSKIVKVGRFSLSFDQGELAKKLLLDSDDYLHRMTNAERAIRMSSKRTDISEEEFRNYVVTHVVDWKDVEITRLIGDFQRIDALAKDLFIKLPDPIHMVKTTGQEDIREAAAYCRGNTIVLNQGTVFRGPFRTLIHELFHIQSQFDSVKRKELYALIGFTECNEVGLPPELAAERLTNPDAPKLNARIHVTVKDKEYDVIPVLLYNASRGWSFFDRLYIKMMVVENIGTQEKEEWKYQETEGKALIFDPKECDNFNSQVGNNTRYNFHPDEVLADNFRFMLLNESVPTPSLTAGIKTLFLKA